MGDRLAQARPVLGKIRLVWGMTFELKFMAIDYSKEALNLHELHRFTVENPAWTQDSK